MITATREFKDNNIKKQYTIKHSDTRSNNLVMYYHNGKAWNLDVVDDKYIHDHIIGIERSGYTKAYDYQEEKNKYEQACLNWEKIKSEGELVNIPETEMNKNE